MKKSFLLLQLCLPFAWAQQYTISTYAGGTKASSTAPLIRPYGVALDVAGNLYVADSGSNLVRKISGSGLITTIAGTGVNGNSGDTGPATKAKLSFPTAVALDSTGNLYVADEGNWTIREVSKAGIITTIAGGGTQPCTDVGNTANSAAFAGPLAGIAVDSIGNVYVSDSFNNCIREISAGLVTTFAGEGPTRYGYLGDYSPPSYTELAAPGGIAFDASGDLYIADSGNGRVREVIKAYNEIYPFAGNGSGIVSGDGGRALEAGTYPRNVAVDTLGNVYIAEVGRVRLVTLDGIIHTIAGTGATGYSGDGGPATGAQFGIVNSLAVDAAGNVYVADTDNNAIRLLTPTWVPFGAFDTPTAVSSNVDGSVGFTGWALSSAAISYVDLWREPNATEGAGLVYIGIADLVPGARPDIALSYPDIPGNNSAGWGYLMLTNQLPSNTGNTIVGNGTYKIHAIAHDQSGRTTDLGVKTIIVNNADASTPFGAIDAPAQGEIISGPGYVNFGWALTPVGKSIPIDGSTIWVYIDNQPVGHPVYNNYRPDIAATFPGYANSQAAVGFFYIDTTKLTNGLHTIAWAVTDDAGAASGIGSRFFTVLN